MCVVCANIWITFVHRRFGNLRLLYLMKAAVGCQNVCIFCFNVLASAMNGSSQDCTLPWAHYFRFQYSHTYLYHARQSAPFLQARRVKKHAQCDNMYKRRTNGKWQLSQEPKQNTPYKHTYVCTYVHTYIHR